MLCLLWKLLTLNCIKCYKFWFQVFPSPFRCQPRLLIVDNSWFHNKKRNWFSLALDLPVKEMHLDAKTSEMQDIGKKGSEKSSLYSSTTFVNNPNWWNSNSTTILQSSYSKNLNMNTDFLAREGNQVVQSRHAISDHDSSTQSSGQSHQEISEMSEDNVHEKHVSFQSGKFQLTWNVVLLF